MYLTLTRSTRVSLIFLVIIKNRSWSRGIHQWIQHSTSWRGRCSRALPASTFGKTAALPACAHVASRSQYLLGPQATAQVLKQLLLTLRQWLSLLCVCDSPQKFCEKLMLVTQPRSIDSESLEVGPKHQDLQSGDDSYIKNP